MGRGEKGEEKKKGEMGKGVKGGRKKGVERGEDKIRRGGGVRKKCKMGKLSTTRIIITFTMEVNCTKEKL